MIFVKFSLNKNLVLQLIKWVCIDTLSIPSYITQLYPSFSKLEYTIQFMFDLTVHHSLYTRWRSTQYYIKLRLKQSSKVYGSFFAEH